jgi:putative hydrolase of the HAD superfamily
VNSILFDLYETLVSFDPRPIRDARERVANHAGVSPDALCLAEQQTMPDRMRGRCGDSVEAELATILRVAGAADDPDLVAVFREAELGAWRQGGIVHDDVVPCLRDLRRRGFRLALVSNCSRLTRPLLEDWNLGDRFDSVVLSCEVGCAKPDPAILRRALEEIDGEADAAMMIDDREAYVDAARDIGLRGYRIARSEASQTSSPPVITSLSQLRELLPSIAPAPALISRAQVT